MTTSIHLNSKDFEKLELLIEEHFPDMLYLVFDSTKTEKEIEYGIEYQ